MTWSSKSKAGRVPVKPAQREWHYPYPAKHGEQGVRRRSRHLVYILYWRGNRLTWVLRSPDQLDISRRRRPVASKFAHPDALALRTPLSPDRHARFTQALGTFSVTESTKAPFCSISSKFTVMELDVARRGCVRARDIFFFIHQCKFGAKSSVSTSATPVVSQVVPTYPATLRQRFGRPIAHSPMLSQVPSSIVS